MRLLGRGDYELSEMPASEAGSRRSSPSRPGLRRPGVRMGLGCTVDAGTPA